MNPDLVTILVGVFAATACALPGTFLVLRGMSLIGDAISHAVLPGIIIAFLITNSVGALPVLLGASVVGLVTVFLIESLYRTRRMKEDASIAVVFPALFALGVLLLARFVEQKDLDLDCVLYGEITFASLDVLVLGGIEISRPMLVLGTVALLNLFFVVALFKELKLATFDAALAAALGISPVVVHYLLMGVVSVTTVASFDSIGAILVVAFLIVPPATAYLLTDRLKLMLVLAVAVGAGSCVLGYFAAQGLNASIAGSMATTMGLVFLVTWMFGPQGVIARLVERGRTKERFERALLLSRLERQPAALDAVVADLAWPEDAVRTMVTELERRGMIAAEAGHFRTTPAGTAFIQSVLS